MKIKLSSISKYSIILLFILITFSVINQVFIYIPLKTTFEDFEDAFKTINLTSTTVTYPLNSMKNIAFSTPERRRDDYTTDIYYDYKLSIITKQETIIYTLDQMAANTFPTLVRKSIIPRHYMESIESVKLNVKQISMQYARLPFSQLELEKSPELYDELIHDHLVLEEELLDMSHSFDLLYSEFLAFSQKLFYFIYGIIIILSLFQTYIILHQLNFQKSLFMKITSSLSLITPFDADRIPHHAIFKEEKDTVKYIEELLREKTFINKTKNILTNYYEMDEFLEALFKEIKPLIGIDRIGVAFIDYDKEVIVAEHGVSSNEKILLGPGFKVGLKETSLSELIDHPVSIVRNDLMAFYKTKPNSSSLYLISEEGIKSNMIMPLVVDHKTLGFIFFSSNQINHFTPEIQRTSIMISSEISDALTRSYMTKLLFTQMTNSFSRLVEKKDTETGAHLDRMTLYSKTIAQGLKKIKDPRYPVDDTFILNIEKYASSHDIGKVGVPDAILKKPGRLDPDELVIMRQHVIMGADLLRDIKENLNYFGRDFFEMAYNITLFHHEKWDGTGYPNAVSGFDIPLEARIVAAADVFDALTSKRVYKDAMPFEVALDILQKDSGKHFDPLIIDIFISELDAIRRIYTEYGEF